MNRWKLAKWIKLIFEARYGSSWPQLIWHTCDLSTCVKMNGHWSANLMNNLIWHTWDLSTWFKMDIGIEVTNDSKTNFNCVISCLCPSVSQNISSDRLWYGFLWGQKHEQTEQDNMINAECRGFRGFGAWLGPRIEEDEIGKKLASCRTPIKEAKRTCREKIKKTWGRSPMHSYFH